MIALLGRPARRKQQLSISISINTIAPLEISTSSISAFDERGSMKQS
jgi:hypothetical protein